jgi:dimethylhistidine N-methyltransferase
METSYTVLDSAEVAAASNSKHDFGLDVLHGLSGSPKQLPSKYFYDETGSRLFQKITELEEYYPTRCELEVLEQNQDAISRLVTGSPFNLVELGVGDGHKTRVIIRRFLEDGHEFDFVPIDISEPVIHTLTEGMDEEFPELRVRGLVSDYFDGVRWLSQLESRMNLVLFLGSNIGNFNRGETLSFLRTLWNSMNHDDLLLIGFDLKKNIETMIRAYNDRKGITRDFNLNLLRRINRELGADFNLDRFEHYATYDVYTGAMESYLVSLDHQRVYIEEIGQSFDFDKYEPIHTEYSYKYLESDIEYLARDTGFETQLNLYDSRSWFLDAVWKVVKQQSKDGDRA